MEEDESQRVTLKYDETYRDLKEYFIKLFKSKSFTPTSFFDKSVFFLQNDLAFQSVAAKKSTINTINPVHRILAKVSINKNDFSKLKVSVNLFCEEIAYYLYSSHLYKENAEAQIKKYNAQELKNIIEEKIKFLSNNQRRGEDSKIEMKIEDFKDFPEDSYTFRVVLKELVQKYENEGKNKEKLMSLFEKMTEIDLVGINEEAEFPEIPFEGLYLDLEKSNKVSSPKFSGSTLSGFHFYVYNNMGKNVFAETETEYFLNIIMAYLEKFCETSNNSFTIPWKLTCKSRVSRKIKGMQDFKLNVVMKFTLDSTTQIEILKRANLIFYNLIANKLEEENAIKVTVNDYFLESSEEILYILGKSSESKENCNCAGCSVF